jgi:hypothetical protein
VVEDWAARYACLFNHVDQRLNVAIRQANIGIQKARVLAALDSFHEPLHSTGQFIAEVRPPPLGFERASEQMQSRDPPRPGVGHAPIMPRAAARSGHDDHRPEG